MRTKDVGTGISKFLKLLPYSVSSLPYDYALRILRSYFQDLDIEIWSRNSHVLKTLNPGTSDLDITVLVKSVTENDYQLLFKRYAEVKKFIPFLGEVNLIEFSEMKCFFTFLNPYEADRDQELKFRYSYSKKKTLAYKICFFLRCLASDTSGIRVDFNSRRRKWNRHLMDLGFRAQRDSFTCPDEIFHFLEQKLLLENIPSYKEGFLEKLIQNYHQDANSWNRFYSSVEVRDFMILAPNRWIGGSFHYQKIQEDLKFIKNFSKIEQELFVAHLEWEVWGLFTQLHQIEDKKKFRIHLENFLVVCESLSEVNHLKYGFEKLLNLQK